MMGKVPSALFVGYPRPDQGTPGQGAVGLCSAFLTASTFSDSHLCIFLPRGLKGEAVLALGFQAGFLI